MNLNSIFISVAYKRLALVDLPERGSNQHEINGARELIKFFQTTEKISGEIKWIYFAENMDPQHATGNFTFYDARKKSTTRTGRTEWRMYYSGDFINYANPGDILILVRTRDENIYGLIFQENSGWLQAAINLFGIADFNPILQIIPPESLSNQQLEFSKEVILQELGIEYELPIMSSIEQLAERELVKANRKGKDFPTAKRMSEIAREEVAVDINNDPDKTILLWLNKEEKLFRAIEHIVVENRLIRGFESVEDFISYSLSVHNRRKSRMGQSLQNHLDFLFQKHNLKFDTQKTTEGKNKPDFLFPGQEEYLNPVFDDNLLVMLGAKSSCKERWRQILTEAARIRVKHLCTLDHTISVYQTDEMIEQNVQLVIPLDFHLSYSPRQQEVLWTLKQFIQFVKQKQSHL